MGGLTNGQAEELLTKYGVNEISQSGGFSVLRVFLEQFSNFLVILLILAGIISFAFGETLDGFFIFLIVILNALFGFYQEFKAERSLQALKKMTVTTVRVKRDGIEQEIDNRLLVPGDVVYLEEGAKVPADGKIFESWNLEVNEASLTGESLPVKKSMDGDNIIYLGTVISRGRCWETVTETGNSTKFGKIAKTLSEIEDVKTLLQIKLEKLTKQIGGIGILASIIVFSLSFIQEKSLIESFLFAVSLAVAAVPEGLPAVMTITLAIGVERMARKKAIVRKLNSIEALGSITVLATDKTGTLTTNKMTVKNVWIDDKNYSSKKFPSMDNEKFRNLVLDGILCSTATINYRSYSDFDVLGDTTEGSVLALAHKLGQDSKLVKEEWKLIDEKPFDPQTRLMSVKVKKDSDTIVFTKGAPESVLKVCRLSKTYRQRVIRAYEGYAKKGLRTMAFAKDKTFLGIVAIADPPRDTVAMAVRKAHEAGIKIFMITGDNELTAKNIGVEAGICKPADSVITGKQLDELNDLELKKLFTKVRIFARTTPEHKFRLVKLLQESGEVVAVTGDGVNDALALKQSDVGVAMGITGTDVAKEAADMVITDDDFSTLVEAVEEGRGIFANIRNSVKYLLACNVGEVLYILTAVLFHLPVLLPMQILYMNLVTDGVPAIFFAFAPKDRQIMKSKPKQKNTLLSGSEFKYVAMAGSLTALVGLLSILPFENRAVAVTVLFANIILVQQLILVDVWVGENSLLKNLKLILNPFLAIAFWPPILIHPLLMYSVFFAGIFGLVPLTFTQAGYAILMALIVILALELRKFRWRNRWLRTIKPINDF